MCSSAVLLHSLLSLTFHLEARIAPIGNEEEKTMTSGLNRCKEWGKLRRAARQGCRSGVVTGGVTASRWL